MTAFLNGYILGWSVAWPPGPINAEMIRRGLLPKERGGGFWGAFPIGLGACTGDFLWAFAVSLGAGALLSSLAVRRVLAVVSLVLLLFLALTFARAAWKIYQTHIASGAAMPPDKQARSGFWLGFVVVLMSPWNIGFWLAVIGSQQALAHGLRASILLALSVVLGALTWGIVLATAVKFGARIFSKPGWQIGTQALTALLMLWFAIRLLLHFP
ncbi:MAG: LysE family transporter [Verrucomicrobiota bacterium]|nr:LysE family transporter [Verrucomicrobiota bacterium]